MKFKLNFNKEPIEREMFESGEPKQEMLENYTLMFKILNCQKNDLYCGNLEDLIPTYKIAYQKTLEENLENPDGFIFVYLKSVFASCVYLDEESEKNLYRNSHLLLKKIEK